MNTNNLKRFAQNARRKLMEQVAARLEFILTTDSPILREKGRQIEDLKKDLQQTGKAQLIEKVAYTWFNRLVALRYMDANDYQPSGIRVITPAEGFVLPQALNEAKQGHIPEMWRVNRQHISDLLDGRIPSANAQNEVFRELLMAACNHLNTVFPFLFERIDDYTELLLPDDLTSQFSVVHDVVEGMADEDCSQVEVIGWLYQFYISEKKDEVFASKSKVKKEDIPAATQLFTPRWIVEYMVQNTVGKLWLINRPNSRLKEHMPYYIEPAEPVTDTLKINSPEEITLLDQACGSGHILVYGFELLYKIYEEEGFNPSEIPALIIENNLHGFEIDSRAAQLSGFALMMKAREHYRRVFRKELKPNIHCFSDLNLSPDEIVRLLKTAGIPASVEMEKDLLLMQQATNYGSLIQPLTSTATLEKAALKTRKALGTAGLFDQDGLRQLASAFEQLAALSRRFTCVVDNPPYMGGGGMNQELNGFVKKYYPDSKSDLMACFMECGLEALQPKGYLGMINQHSWMFLSSYEKLREKLIESIQFDSLLHLGSRTFPEIGGEVVQNVSFTLINSYPKNNSCFFRLVDFESSSKKRDIFIKEKNGFTTETRYYINQIEFLKIAGNRLGYWLSDRLINAFDISAKLGQIASLKAGLQTGNNDRFVRNWWEIIKLDIRSDIQKTQRYAFYDKGGPKRKWFGNQWYVVDWKDEGNYISNNSNPVFRNRQFYFKKGLSYSLTNTSSIGFRFRNELHIFDNQGSSLFSSDDILPYILGYANSKIVENLTKLLNPTMVIQVGDLSELPLIMDKKCLKKVESIVSECIVISENDWNYNEVSFSFNKHSLFLLVSINIQNAFTNTKNILSQNFLQLHHNEEELNRIFIDIYGLQDELTPDVPLEEITILQQELDRTALAKLNKKLKRDPETRKVLNYDEIKLPFDAKEVMAQLVSYAVGCMFGRYSLEAPGLILANQGEGIDDYYKKVDSGRWMVDGDEKVNSGRWMVDGDEKVDSGPTTHQSPFTTHQPPFNQNIYEQSNEFQRAAYMAASDGSDQNSIYTHEGDAQGGALWADQSNQTGSSEHSEQHSRRSGEGDQRVYPLSDHSERFAVRTGNPVDPDNQIAYDTRGENSTHTDGGGKPTSTNQFPKEQTPTTHYPPITTHHPPSTTHHPLTTNHYPLTTFPPDEDNIIPVLDEDWFEDDIAGRFRQFLKAAFGTEHFEENLAFVEQCLGKDIRSYFARDFYPDHIRRYKKRPIYWMFSSPRGAFSVLIYMHRYTPDTVSNILNGYLRQYQEKLRLRRQHLQHVQNTGTATEKTQAIRETDRIDRILIELHEYERDILYPLAANRIAIDLDDGVLVNYNRFGKAIKEVTGLNDTATKKKVKAFDWVDTSNIF